MKWIHIGVVLVLIAVMFATYYMPDVLYGFCRGDSQNLLLFAYFTRLFLIFICSLTMAVFYVVDIIIKIRNKRLPKDFFKPSKMVIRVLVTVIFIALTVFFVIDTSATTSDYNSEPVYVEYDVMNVKDLGTGMSFVINDGETGSDDDAPMHTCYLLDGINFESGYKYRFRLYESTSVYVAVERIGATAVAQEG